MLNNLIEYINKYLEEGGYSLSPYKSIFDLEIIDITYSEIIQINKKFSFKKYVGCISKVFNIIESDLNKGIKMQYKRVSNFNNLSSQNAFIITLINKNKSVEYIINELEDNYSISQEEAKQIYLNFLEEVKIEYSLNENKRLRIRDNPGFKTSIDRIGFTSNILILVCKYEIYKCVSYDLYEIIS